MMEHKDLSTGNMETRIRFLEQSILCRYERINTMSEAEYDRLSNDVDRLADLKTALK